jgi:hypothetical protein
MDNEEIQYRKVNPNDVYESLKCSKFKQQQMNAWRPFPTLLSTVVIKPFSIKYNTHPHIQEDIIKIMQ